MWKLVIDDDTILCIYAGSLTVSVKMETQSLIIWKIPWRYKHLRKGLQKGQLPELIGAPKSASDFNEQSEWWQVRKILLLTSRASGLQKQHFIRQSVSPKKVKVNCGQQHCQLDAPTLSVRWIQITLRGIVCALRLVSVKWGQAKEWSCESDWSDSRSLGG